MFDPTNGNIAYAALYANGVYKSTNGGLTWTAINGTGTNNLPLTHAGRIALAIAPSSPTTLYAGIQNATGSSLLGLFKTTDGGSNWTKLFLALAHTKLREDKGKEIKAEPIGIAEYRMTSKRLQPGERADGVVTFDRPTFKESAEKLELQVAESGQVDHPVRVPVPFVATSTGGTQ